MMNTLEKALVIGLLDRQEETNDVREAINSVKNGSTDGSSLCTDLGDFLVLTEDERDIEYNDAQTSLIDDLGLDSFTDYAKEHIINNLIDTDTFDESRTESNESYIEDIRGDGDRLAEEMEDAGCDTEDEYLDHLDSEYDSGVEWYIDMFGDEQFAKVVNDNGLMDLDAVIEWCKEVDGYAHTLSGYDGVETEVELNGVTYYLYRTN